MDTRKMATTILVAILALSLDACGAKPSPTVSAMDIADTAQAVVFTMIAQTQAALPTAPISISLPLTSFLDPNYEAQFGFRAIVK